MKTSYCCGGLKLAWDWFVQYWWKASAGRFHRRVLSFLIGKLWLWFVSFCSVLHWNHHLSDSTVWSSKVLFERHPRFRFESNRNMKTLCADHPVDRQGKCLARRNLFQVGFELRNKPYRWFRVCLTDRLTWTGAKTDPLSLHCWKNHWINFPTNWEVCVVSLVHWLY